MLITISQLKQINHIRRVTSAYFLVGETMRLLQPNKAQISVQQQNEIQGNRLSERRGMHTQFLWV